MPYKLTRLPCSKAWNFAARKNQFSIKSDFLHSNIKTRLQGHHAKFRNLFPQTVQNQFCNNF